MLSFTLLTLTIHSILLQLITIVARTCVIADAQLGAIGLWKQQRDAWRSRRHSVYSVRPRSQELCHWLEDRATKSLVRKPLTALIINKRRWHKKWRCQTSTGVQSLWRRGSNADLRLFCHCFYGRKKASLNPSILQKRQPNPLNN